MLTGVDRIQVVVADRAAVRSTTSIAVTTLSILEARSDPTGSGP